ncbi:hypothetical protein JHK87_022553 [Glycine soja]|nr:hypothetical protein JHK87_022553 [Glycine soja]
MELEVRDATSGADDGAKAYVGATNDNKKPTNEDANKHMEPTTEATTNINMDPKEGELNDDVVVKENDAEGVTIYGAASKDIDEVAKFIGTKSLSIADIFPLVEAEALACLEAINWLRELGYQCAIIEIDCKGVVDGVRGNWMDQSSILVGFGGVNERMHVMFGSVRHCHCLNHQTLESSKQ